MGAVRPNVVPLDPSSGNPGMDTLAAKLVATLNEHIARHPMTVAEIVGVFACVQYDILADDTGGRGHG